MANAAAQGLLTPVEQATIQDHAGYLMSRPGRTVDQLELTTGKVVRIKGTRIVVGNDIAGVVIEIALVAEGAPLPPPSLAIADQPVPRLTLHSGSNLILPPLGTPSTLSGSGQSPCGSVPATTSRLPRRPTTRCWSWERPGPGSSHSSPRSITW